MKTGLNIVELATEIERQQSAKRDLVVKSDKIEMGAVRPERDHIAFQLMLAGKESYTINDHAHRQIADYTGIPAKYYDKMRREAPDLLADNVNAWMTQFAEPRMVRTMDGAVRALLSDRYRPLENSDLAEAVLPTLADLGVTVMSAAITEQRLYIKVVDQRIMQDIPSGRKFGDGSHVFFDTVSPAAVISNSEVGAGALRIEAGVYTKVCTNLAIAGQRSMKKYHTGAKHELLEGEHIQHLLTDDTKRLQDQTLWATVRDVVKGAFEEARFAAYCDELRGLSKIEIEADPIKVLDLAKERFGFNETEKGSVLKHLIEGGDLTAYGLFNAVTRTAQDLDDYDRATEFEKLGGVLIELPKQEWKELAMAA